MSYGREQWFMITAVGLFLVGAAFMLVSVFAGAAWALWVGFAFAVLALGAYIIVVIDQRRFSKKFTPSKAEKEAVDEEAIVAVTAAD